MQNVNSKSLKQPSINVIEKFKMMNKFTWRYA